MEDSPSILPAETGIAPKAYLNLSLFHEKEAPPQIIEEVVAADPFLEDYRGLAECPDFSINGRIQKIPCTYGIPPNCILTRNFKVKETLIEEKIPYHWYYNPENNKWLGLLVEKKYEGRFSGELRLGFFSESGYVVHKAKKPNNANFNKKNNKNARKEALERNRQICANKKPKMDYKHSGRFA